MLSLSAGVTQSNVNLQMIHGDQSATDGDVRYAKELIDFAQSLVSRDEEALLAARDALLQKAGQEVLVDAAAVAANFQRMVRIADATGIPLDAHSVALSTGVRQQLQLERFASSRNTPALG